MKRIALTLMSAALLSACSAPQLPQVNPSVALRAESHSKVPSIRSDEGVRQGVIAMRKIRFQKWDKNKDLLLTRDEVSDNNLRMPSLISGFKDYDKNDDGKITMTEFLKSNVIAFWMDLYLAITDDEFFILDHDRNGVLNGFEKDAPGKLFARWPEFNGGDIDKNGEISYDEFQNTYMKVAPYLSKTARTENLPQS